MHERDFIPRWKNAWRALGVASPEGELTSLLARWDEPHRHYHDRRHLEECLARFDTAKARAQGAAECELALWYHDAVYEARSSENEERSADLADVALQRAGVERTVVTRVRALILATKHEAAPETPDAALVVDVDLGIFAAPAARFDEYEQDVRSEYGWVPEILFKHKRKQVLKSFLDRPRIFTSGAFDADEAAARANIKRSIARL